MKNKTLPASTKPCIQLYRTEGRRILLNGYRLNHEDFQDRVLSKHEAAFFSSIFQANYSEVRLCTVSSGHGQSLVYLTKLQFDYINRDLSGQTHVHLINESDDI